MKRRSLLKSAAVLPAAAVLPGPAAAQSSSASAASDLLKLELSPPDAAGQPVSQFFTPDQFSALRKLGELFVPAFNGRPGAVEAGAAEFLDFYVSQTQPDRQEMYRSGLDRLNGGAQSSYGKKFGEISAEQAAPLLKPLADPWTYKGPSGVYERFLLAAKEDLMRATVNSRAYATALSATSRSSGGVGYYWLPIE